MNWFVLALLAALSIAADEIAQKIALTRKVNITALTNNTYIWLMQGISGFLIAAFLGRLDTITGWQNWLKLLLLALVYFIGGTAYYTSYKSNSPSVSIVLGSISVVISTAIGIVVFGESTELIKFIGILLILAAIFIVNFNRKKFTVDKYNSLALLGGIMYGFGFSIDKSFVLEMNPYAYLGFMSTSVGVLSLLLRSRHIITETKKLNFIDFVPMIVIAVLGVMFNLFSFASYSKGGSVGAVDAINNSAIFFVILAEVLFLNDRKNLIKKIFSSFIVVSGLILLSTI